VIFGASGDLTKRLLVPALYNLSRAGLLPDGFVVISIARAEESAESWKFATLEEPTADEHPIVIDVGGKPTDIAAEIVRRMRGSQPEAMHARSKAGSSRSAARCREPGSARG
jgi:hypothetical protein